ncbi:single-stranded DNA-binding protein [Chondrinema litorale]|uniref:single-stranded DNA-binding protein n=1 Tax=Chondrinema litorale TaxID=2994555 RepID=UPI0025436477|nr:single-stranded DNA-binding protein [Chondrinema litorale]UZR95838.1 single-stranded DNA-binding protein [Chondrinema litorale]
MAGVNKVILIGNLGQDPEVRHLESGSVVARLNIATTESYKDRSGNRVDNTEWHDVEMWDGLAKVAESYLRKGDSIYIEGKIRTDKWEDKEGNPRKTIKIRAINMTMLSKGQSTPGNESQSSPKFEEPTAQIEAPGGDADDLPF